MSDSTELVVHGEQKWSVEEVLNRLSSVKELMRRAMDKGIDYGEIPGTNSKPTLLKAGAEKLCVMFRLAPKYETKKTFHEDGHLTVESTCKIFGQDESFLGEGSAMCSTRESKYRYRGGARVCPQCGKPAIKKSKFPPRNDPQADPGFYCFGKIGGCGANFAANDQEITSQSEAKTENPDLADCYNTVLRIAEKRSYIAAVRLVTGSSSLFDEEGPGHGTEAEPAQHAENDHVPTPAPKPEPETPYDPIEGEAYEQSLRNMGSVTGVKNVWKVMPPQYRRVPGMCELYWTTLFNVAKDEEELKLIWVECVAARWDHVMREVKDRNKARLQAEEVPA